MQFKVLLKVYFVGLKYFEIYLKGSFVSNWDLPFSPVKVVYTMLTYVFLE